MLMGKVISSIDVTGEGIQDDAGHGTFVAGIISGNRMDNTPFGTLEGLAQGTRLISIRVFDWKGDGALSWLVAGLDEAAAAGADIINYSGGGRNGPLDGPQERAVNLLSALGIITVTSAGNDGQIPVDTPGTAAGSVCVGALNFCMEKAWWSNKGSAFRGTIKPDAMAPGEAIAGAATGWLDGFWDGKRTGFDVFTGTSFATPQITAILAQAMQAAGRRIGREEVETLLSLGKEKKDFSMGWGVPDAERMQREITEKVLAL